MPNNQSKLFFIFDLFCIHRQSVLAHDPYFAVSDLGTCLGEWKTHKCIRDFLETGLVSIR